MTYSIGAVAEMFGLSVPTLRYYDKEGLLPKVKRSDGGVRRFDSGDIECLRVVECLKKTGMPLKDIRVFLAWCSMGDASLEKRRDMFLERRQEVKRQMEELEGTLKMVEFKCRYYETAVKAGTERVVLDMRPDELPEIAKKIC